MHDNNTFNLVTATITKACTRRGWAEVIADYTEQDIERMSKEETGTRTGCIRDRCGSYKTRDGVENHPHKTSGKGIGQRGRRNRRRGRCTGETARVEKTWTLQHWRTSQKYTFNNRSQRIPHLKMSTVKSTTHSILEDNDEPGITVHSYLCPQAACYLPLYSSTTIYNWYANFHLLEARSRVILTGRPVG